MTFNPIIISFRGMGDREFKTIEKLTNFIEQEKSFWTFAKVDSGMSDVSVYGTDLVVV